MVSGSAPTPQRARDDALATARDSYRTGGAFTTVISAFALAFSGFSFYESVLKAPNLALYVPPQIAYTDPDRPDSPLEVFIVPLTLANDGARTGTGRRAKEVAWLVDF